MRRQTTACLALFVTISASTATATNATTWVCLDSGCVVTCHTPRACLDVQVGTTRPDGTPIDEQAFPYLEVVTDCTPSAPCLQLRVNITRQHTQTFPQIVHCPPRSENEQSWCAVSTGVNSNVNQICSGPATHNGRLGSGYTYSHSCNGTAAQTSKLVVNCYDADIKQGDICSATALSSQASALVRPFH